MKAKKKDFRRCLLIITLLVILTGCAQEIQVLKLNENKERVQVYELFELSFTLPEYPSSYSIDDIRLVFTTPSGKDVTVPAFQYQDYTSRLQDGKEVLTKKGELLWKARFTPLEAGNYSYKLFVKDKKSVEGSFEAEPSSLDGFVRAKDSYFVFDSGKHFFPVGMNVAWAGSKGTYDYDYYFGKISENMGNYARIIMASWDTAIEWESTGGYSLENAWKLDKVLETAAAENIYLVISFDIYGILKEKSDDPREMLWEDNPYNKRKKGMLDNPEEFFTNKEAIETYKKKLDYIVTRWGYSPNILAWELWNEADVTDNYDEKKVCTWHREAASYLKSVDHNKHLITTSCAFVENCRCAFSLPEISYTQVHTYEPLDEMKIRMIAEEMKVYKKPWLLSEFGLGGDSKTLNKDIKGEYLNKTMWLAAEASSGSAMPWWWDEYIDNNNLYHLFKPLSSFMTEK